MLKFTYKAAIRERVEGKCPRHPGYNPEKSGRGGIKGGCCTCFTLYDVLQARLKLDAAIHEFVRQAGPWARPRERRKRKSTAESPAPADAPKVQR